MRVFKLFILLFIGVSMYGQGASCATAEPFCTAAGATFPASTNTTAPTGPNYDCLGSQPNPAWYYLNIDQSGNLDISLSNNGCGGSGCDIDFVCWGPFPDQATMTSLCGSMGSPPANVNGSVVDCSFSTAVNETLNIPNAQSGEWYMVLITNFSGNPTDITVSQTGGTGSTDCSIINPTCTMNSLTATVTGCSSNPFLEFEVGGTVTYTDPPTTGQLIIQDCYGVQQTFNAPFGLSTNYTITGLPQDGLNCDITAYFTDDPACTITTGVTAPSPITSFSSNCVIGGGQVDGTIGFSNPPAGSNLIVEISDGTNTIQDVIPMPAASPQNWSVAGLDPAANPYTITYYFDNFPACSQATTINCGCSADGGTNNAAVTGNGTNNYVLCDGDQIDITTNNDYSFPDDIGPIGGFAYQPGLAYMIFSCPPTAGVFPGNDPCIVGVIPQLDDLTDINNGGSLFDLYGGFATFPTGTVYYTPITLYHYDPVANNYIVNSNCWDVGDVFSVTYLNPIADVATPDCQTASVDVVLTGGYPEFDGSDYTVSNLVPNTATFANTTTTHNGTITINGLQNGDNWSFDVVDANGCPYTVSGGPFVGVPTPDAGADDNTCTLTYNLAATASYGNITWTGPAGAVFANANAANTTVTVPAAGTYTFTYTEDNGGGCVASDDVVIVFSDLQYTEVHNDPTCGNADGDITLNASNGIAPYDYSIDNGATTSTSGAFANLSASSYDIVITDDIGCSTTGNIVLTNQGGPTINGVTTVDITCNAACDGSLSINATGANQFSIDNGVTFGALNNFTNLCPGNYDIVVEDAIGCQVTSTASITEPAALTHTEVTSDLLCANECIGSITITPSGGTMPYTYSIDNGVTTSAIGDFQNLCAGNYTILVTDANLCTSTSNVVITEPNPLQVTIGITDATCFGLCDGTMNSIPSGGSGAGTYNYAWTPAVGGNTPLITNLCAGSYNLSVTDANGCTLDTNGIVVGAPMAVVIDNVVTVDETCGGDCDGQVTISAPGATEFSIDGVNYVPNNVFTNLCAGQYNVYAQDNAGCGAQDVALITGPPPVTATVNPDTTICIGGTAQLSSTPGGGVGGYIFNWDNGLGNTQNANVSPTTQTTYCLTVEDANGCSSPLVCTNVFMNQALSVIALSDQSICEGDDASLSALASGGNGGPYNYTWDQGLPAGQNQTVTPGFTTVYTVSATDGCETPAATASVTITVNTIPNIGFSADNLNGCYPVDVNFTEQNVPAGASCFWTFGDGGTSTDCNPFYQFNQPGCWDVTLDITTAEGCLATFTQPSYICAYDYPVADFEFGPTNATVLDPIINFTNTSTGASGYLWNFDPNGQNGSSFDVDPSFAFTGDAGQYTTCLTATSVEGCIDSVCKEITILEEFILYVPNAFTPNGDSKNNLFTPVISGIDPTSYEFYVFNRWGELIYESYFPGEGWDGIYKGLMSQQDVYVWKLKVTDQTGQQHDYIGHVTLIK